METIFDEKEDERIRGKQIPGINFKKIKKKKDREMPHIFQVSIMYC
jgi:hypothetical protein